MKQLKNKTAKEVKNKEIDFKRLKIFMKEKKKALKLNSIITKK